MRLGKVKISKHLIHESLGLPQDWEIEKMSYQNDGHNDLIDVLMSGPDFQDAINDSEVKNYKILIYKENIHFEVEEVK